MDAATMKETWANPIHGDARIARNYVPESVGLEAIAYCEKMVGLLDLDDNQQAMTWPFRPRGLSLPSISRWHRVRSPKAGL
jgi:hypothetical protein